MFNKRQCSVSPGGSPQKIRKSSVALPPSATATPLVNQKLAELEKLRQQHMEGVTQLIDSLENVKKEFAEGGDVVDLQQELYETEKMCDALSQEIIKIHEREIEQSENISAREEKSDTLSSKFTELWECQKTVCNYMEEITELLRMCEDNTKKIGELYEEVTVKQNADSIYFNDQLQNIMQCDFMQYNDIEKELRNHEDIDKQEAENFTKLKLENELLEQDLQKYETLKAEKNSENQELDIKLNELVTSHQTSKKSRAEEKSKLIKEIDIIINKKHSFDKLIKDEEIQSQTLQVEINNIKKQQQIIFEKTEKLKIDNTNIQDEIKKIEKNVAGDDVYNSQIQQIQAQITNCISEKREIEEKYIQIKSVLISKKNNFISRIENSKISENDVESTKQKLETEISKSTELLNKSKMEINQYENQIKTSRKLLEKLELKVKTHENKLEKLENDKKYKCKELKDKISEMQAKLKEIQDETANLRKLLREQRETSLIKTEPLKYLDLEDSEFLPHKLEKPQTKLLPKPFMKKIETFSLSSDEENEPKDFSDNEEDEFLDQAIRRLSQSSVSSKKYVPPSRSISASQGSFSSQTQKKFFTSRKTADDTDVKKKRNQGRGRGKGRAKKL